MNATEYLPNEFFQLLTSKLCDKINDQKVSRSRHNILLVLRDTIDSGKFQTGHRWGNSQIMQMAYARGCGTGEQSKHSSKCSIKWACRYRRWCSSCTKNALFMVCHTSFHNKLTFSETTQLTMKSSQRPFEIRYSTPRSSLHLDVH